MVFIIILICVAAFVLVVMITANNPCLAQVTGCIYGKLKGNGIMVNSWHDVLVFVVVLVLAVLIALLIDALIQRRVNARLAKIQADKVKATQLAYANEVITRTDDLTKRGYTLL